MKTPKSNYVKMYVCLGSQPVLKTMGNGKRMANFFATNVTPSAVCPPHMQPQTGTKWFRVVSWDKVAESAGRHLYKGKKVLLVGNLLTQQFRTRKGKVLTKEVIVASDIVLLDPGKTPYKNAA